MSDAPEKLTGMLVVIGAMKCGTSTLHEHLRLHPEISMSRVKELNYFLPEPYEARSAAWYRSRFDFSKPVRGESSPNYTKWPTFRGVPERLHAVMPDAKLVYVMRDPIERAVSHYRHNVSHGRETRPLAEALGAAEDNKYVTTSSYHLQISKFLEFFPREQLRLFELRELASDPRGVSQSLFEWLGVDPTFDDPGFDRVLHASSRKGRPTPLARRIQSYPGGRAVRTILSRWLEDPLPKPLLDDATRSLLEAALRPDIAKLREFWGRDLSNWNV